MTDIVSELKLGKTNQNDFLEGLGILVEIATLELKSQFHMVTIFPFFMQPFRDFELAVIWIPLT